MVPRIVLTACLFTACCATFAQAPLTGAQNAGQRELRAIYQELVEINTTDSAGDCTRAAEAMGSRLRAGGYTQADVQVLVPPGAPKKGNLVARLAGTGAAKPLLMLAHIDVVEAKREDWIRDPFKLIEEGGYFYARGASDNKAMAAVFVANLIRWKREGLRPSRDLVLALTCDEEIIPSPHNGVEFLLRQHRPLVEAEFAINEGGGGVRSADGRRLRVTVQAGEKVFQSWQLEVTSKGGHSALPVADNPITHLADGLARLGRFEFPFKLLETPRRFFERMAALEPQRSIDMRAMLAEPPDLAAAARLAASSPQYNALMRNTCIATMVEAGHATNAQAQRARAVVNCRILPGEPVAQVRDTLVRVLANDRIAVTPMGEAVPSPAAPLRGAMMQAIESVTAQMYPGVPLIPTMSAGATDSRFLNNAGIPTYGVSGMFRDADGGGVHGLNERFPVSSLYEGQEYLYRLVMKLAAPR
jgi:acetylornithine deacetylase/succinyl-diaminopimelate desuccinylase-like protein